MIFTLQKRHRITVSSKRRKKKMARCALFISGAAVFGLIFCFLVAPFWTREKRYAKRELPDIRFEEKLLKKNEYSRPGTKLKKVAGVVVHYTANPGTDAMDNRNYFNNLPSINKGMETKTYASSHFVIGLEGQIVQCVPLDEIAYASNQRNRDTISIECCHPDVSGKFNKATLESLKDLLVWLCITYDLDEEDIIRHYDVTGKKCPLFFVENEDEWISFKKEIGHTLRD